MVSPRLIEGRIINNSFPHKKLPMDRLTSLRVFREVVEAGGFARAAARLDLSAPMASKHVALLERDLGARLLHRTSRKLSLTEAGEMYYAQCREVLDTLQAAEAALRQSAQAPRGQIKISAPVWCANRHFADVLVAYHDTYPEVLVDMRLENRKIDLVADGYDLALRATREPSPALIARPICRVRFHLVASPTYLKREGFPRSLAELAKCSAVVPNYVNLDGVEMQGPAGKARIRLHAVMRSDDSTLTYHAVHAGMGVAFLPEWTVGDDLAAGRLESVLPAYTMPPIMLYAVYTSRQYMTPKLRTFIDFFSEALGGVKSVARRPDQ